ncbi:3-hydroxyacyl-ACP dehydratase FabZ family protein [Flavobacterium gawalongense]|uniref:Hydroxymyristoyl-ACP dehydratase n=1 Tax=Flavobacterium gawalongense TaxID=2594432 RepID=A0A553BER8_9FLAO|nr:hydroxymyristoyl-ACP dehydratase [Flavobacterium gawalongense]TRW99061.1 hydroxymyristoyl-ACP dehydratase [Flavobacterium gawalongense]TRX03817.1 hydroxymyristoyl-ACP dehydratase [Flavobacterium gawalongense]TRX06702.1 hydroxymyristoyl-ACP dehydratase [Flavobacterium gawalongense]TRX07601.1 hydroxymyristoyl-ACP dehydratase [Flavobacterium gawalongense]TRX23430.1 hydroxymyristoyl-ACP dehydratase [Flavobacterium gawalongense]
MRKEEIISKLPYSKPFLFVDEIVQIDENGVEGNYTFDENHDFYKGHFKECPVTPGVILTEVMAQIGLVCLGIFLLNDTLNKTASIALTSTEIDFLKPVFPNEKVIVISEKIYFRFGKLKCKVKMINEKGEMVCTGTIAGMILTPTLSKGDGAKTGLK